MQFIENSVLAVRAAHYVLARDSESPRFELFPMIHVGSADYYAQVRGRLDSCDTILFEGVGTLRARIMTLSYSLLTRRRRLGLVTQRSALPLTDLRAKLVHADVTAEEFYEKWGRVPWHWRVAVAICAPSLGVYRYFTATRRSIGKRLTVDDLPSREAALSGESLQQLDDVIMGSRDKKLVAKLEDILAQSRSDHTIGIVYGAAHMRAVTAALMGKLRYRVVQSEWLTVFDY